MNQVNYLSKVNSLFSRRVCLVLGVGVILLLGLLLRVVDIDRHYWYDEACSIQMTNDISEYFDDSIREDKNPPLYFIFLAFWIKFFGQSEVFLRIPSVFFSVVSILLVFFLAREVFDNKIAVLSSLVFAVLPFNIWHSQEVRPYSLSVFLTLFMVLLCVKYIKKRSLRTLSLFLTFSVLSIYCTYYAWLLFIPLGVILLRSRILVFNSKVFVLFFLSLSLGGLLLAEDIVSIYKSFWTFQSDFSQLLSCVHNIALGYNATMAEYRTFFVYTVYLITFSFFYKKTEFSKKNGFFSDGFKSWSFIFLLFIFPLVGSFMIGFFVPVFISKKMIIIVPFFCILISAGCFSSKFKFVQFCLVIITLSFFVLPLVRYYKNEMPSPWWHRHGIHPRKNYEKVIENIKMRITMDDYLVYSDLALGLPLVEQYMKGVAVASFFMRIPEKESQYVKNTYKRVPCPVWDPEIDNLTGWGAIGVKDPYEKHRRIDTKKEVKGSRLFLLSSNWDYDGSICKQSQYVLSKMASLYVLIDSTNIGGIYIHVFSLES